MININLVIGYLEKTENLIVPENVRFSSFEEMYATAQEQNWLDVPIQEKIESTWLLIKDGLQAEQDLYFAKQNKFSEIDNKFNLAIEQGYYDKDFNIRLKLQDYDRNSFSQYLNMLKLAEDLNAAPETDTIADINGNLHELTILNIKILLLRYGIYYKTVWNTYTNHKANISNETVLENVINYTV